MLPEIILQKRRLPPLCPAGFFVVPAIPSPSVHRAKVATLPPYSLEQECICDMYRAPGPHITTEESKFSSLYCLGHAFPSNQNIFEALLQTPPWSHSIFSLNYCGLLAIAQLLWEKRLCCSSELRTDQVKGERKGRKIIFRFFETYNNSFWKDN